MSLSSVSPKELVSPDYTVRSMTISLQRLQSLLLLVVLRLSVPPFISALSPDRFLVNRTLILGTSRPRLVSKSNGRWRTRGERGKPRRSPSLPLVGRFLLRLNEKLRVLLIWGKLR